MNTNFILWGVCLFGGMIIGALLSAGSIEDVYEQKLDEVINQREALKTENERLKAILNRVLPDNSLWGFTKGADRK